MNRSNIVDIRQDRQDMDLCIMTSRNREWCRRERELEKLRKRCQILQGLCVALLATATWVATLLWLTL